jgi:hypothetical protein
MRTVENRPVHSLGKGGNQRTRVWSGEPKQEKILKKIMEVLNILYNRFLILMGHHC